MKNGVNTFAAAFAIGALSIATVASAGLVNPGFEAGDAQPNMDVFGAPGWGGFNAHFTTVQAARTGTKSIKIFGPFGTQDQGGQFGGAGAIQGIAVSPGELIEASAWGFDAGSADPDGLTGTNFGIVQLSFLNAANQGIGLIESARIDASAPNQVWQFMSASGIAPAGAVRAEIILLHIQLGAVGNQGGAVFYDDASLAVIPEPSSALALVGALPLVLRRRR